MRKADNLPPSCAVVTKSGNLNFLEPSESVQACNGTDFTFKIAPKYFIILIVSTYYILCISWIIKCVFIDICFFIVTPCCCAVIMGVHVFICILLPAPELYKVLFCHCPAILR